MASILRAVMHEASIMLNTLTMAEKQARDGGYSAIHVLRLRVGELSGVVPEALEFAFEAFKSSTLAAGARLEIERVPAIAFCRNCACEFRPDMPVFLCPQCGQLSAEIRSGRELHLTSVEVS